MRERRVAGPEVDRLDAGWREFRDRCPGLLRLGGGAGDLEQAIEQRVGVWRQRSWRVRDDLELAVRLAPFAQLALGALGARCGRVAEVDVGDGRAWDHVAREAGVQRRR